MALASELFEETKLTMKTIGPTLFFLLLALASLGFSQSIPPDQDVLSAAQPSTVKPLPPYMVYRHFLGWVNELDKSAVAAKATDLYQFAEPFGRANLQHVHLDILRTEAHRLPPGIAALGLPGGGLQIPLFVRDNTSKCKSGDFSLQGIEINAQLSV